MNATKKQNEEAKGRLVIQMIAAGACIAMGAWMIIAPGRPEDTGGYRKASVQLLNDIWGMPAGIVFASIGVIWTLLCIRSLRRLKSQNA